MVSMHPNSFCYALMGILFAYSASVQLNDTDWYFWLPVYSFASVVNVMSVIHLNRSSSYTRMVLVAFWSGLAMLVKVVMEACLFESKSNAFEWKELLSLGMERRVVREKLGSGLVVVSTYFLHNHSQIGSSASRKVGLGVKHWDFPEGHPSQYYSSLSALFTYSNTYRMILLLLVSGMLCMVFILSAKEI